MFQASSGTDQIKGHIFKYVVLVDYLGTQDQPDLGRPQWSESTPVMNRPGYREAGCNCWLLPETKCFLLRWRCASNICSKDPKASHTIIVSSKSALLNPTGSPVTLSGDSQLHTTATFSGRVRLLLLSFPTPPRDRKGKMKGRKKSTQP